jgi:hypothetical protein
MLKHISTINARFKSGLPDECTLKDVENFYRCMEAYKMDPNSIEIAKLAYCRNPQSSMTSYAAMARRLPEPKRAWVKATDMVITPVGKGGKAVNAKVKRA